MAATLNRGRSSVDRRLRHLNLGTAATRTGTMAATAANMATAANRRAALELSLLVDAERLRLQMFAPTVAFNFGGKDNSYAEVNLDQPIMGDQLKLMQAIGIAVTHSLKIADHDADTGIADAIGMLDAIAAAIGSATADMPEPA